MTLSPGTLVASGLRTALFLVVASGSPRDGSEILRIVLRPGDAPVLERIVTSSQWCREVVGPEKKRRTTQ